MSSPPDVVLILVVLTNLIVIGIGDVRLCIRVVAAQGVLLGLLPLLMFEQGFDANLLLIAAATLLLKGYVFPWLLFRTMHRANVPTESVPMLGFTMSKIIAVLLVVASFWVGGRFRELTELKPGSDLTVPVALATLLSGLFFIVSRRQALMQVLGYLVLENGVFVFGVAMAHEEPLLVEMGILLDVFVAVLVMGVAMFHISREFDHIDVERMTELRD
jgi:hydrogenase-4 component E